MPYLGSGPGIGQSSVFVFTATEGQSAFSGADSNGYVLNYSPGQQFTEVYLDGRLLVATSDYTATNGSTVTLASGVTAGTTLMVVSQATYNPSGAVSFNQSQTLSSAQQLQALDNLNAASRVLPKTGTYTVIAADRGKLILASSAPWTLTLTGGSTLGDGFEISLRNNSGSGSITVSPASGTINGSATLTVTFGSSCRIFCDGTNFYTTGI